MSLLGTTGGSQLFNRIAKLTVESSLKGIAKEFKSDTRDAAGEYVPGFRFVFKVVKNSESFPNSAQIQIYNLNEESRALFQQKDARIKLNAGYAGTEELIFSGDVSKCSTKSANTDYVTEIEAGDGLKAFQDTKLDKSYSPGTSTTQIVSQIVKEFSLAKRDMSGVRAASYIQGLSLSGNCRDHMDMVCKKMGAEWSIQDGAIQVIKKGEATIDTAVRLAPDTGMIGIPVKKDQGIELSSLLQPKIYPGRKINVESKFIKGTFTVLTVTHTGDTRGKEYYSHMEAL